MKYLILSDIHGSLPALEKALALGEREGCDMICILGDILNYGPRNGLPDGLDAKGIAERLNALADRIVAVRGNCDSEVDQMLLRFPIMQTYMLLVDDGVRLLLTHGHIYNKVNLPPGSFDVVLYGHTHRWLLEEQGGTLFCNTGSITFPKEQREPTVAIYAHRTLSIYNLDGKKLAEKSIINN